jgi:beta-alanine degradation protein BauB
VLLFAAEDFMKMFLLGAIFASSIIFGVHSQQASQQGGQTRHEGQTQRIPLLENDDVKVWKSVIIPDAPLAMHRHEHPRVIVAMTGGTMKIVEQNGPAVSHVWETGKAYWLPANPPNTLHADVNAGDKPLEVVVVELKKEN